MRTKIVIASLAVLISSVSAGERGIVGIVVDAAPDFRVITSIVPDSPAAQAGVRIGDRILAIDGHPTSQLHSAQELVSRAAGVPDTQVELQLMRAGEAHPLRVRIQRVVPPVHHPPKFVPDPSGFVADGHIDSLPKDAANPLVHPCGYPRFHSRPTSCSRCG
jgi:membrane-associated protease RseP (regulator of RpoE activity)